MKSSSLIALIWAYVFIVIVPATVKIDKSIAEQKCQSVNNRHELGLICEIDYEKG